MEKLERQIIQDKFKGRVRKTWSFQNNRSIEQLTHGYHRYPAKFVPQLVSKLIEKYSLPNDTIADVFAGCGTTLVEGKMRGRVTIGVDINPVAQLITRAKTNPVEHSLLQVEFNRIIDRIRSYRVRQKYYDSNHERIDYWFEEKQKNKISFLYQVILEIIDDKSKDFFLCALSNILKNCSRWLQDGTKPQIDPTKTPAEVFASFRLQVKKMMVKNQEYYTLLKSKKNLSTACTIKLADARHTRIRASTINTIITSPPYVTSYEYADIHQLTGYWFEYISDITSFRRKFIGTFYSSNTNLKVNTPTAQEIVSQLKEKEMRLAREVANYFRDMHKVSKEMMRILQPNGVVCLVIGNTEFKKVKIKSAQAFAEMLSAAGFEIEEVIKRSIPHKINPTIRDKATGKFTTLKNKNSKKAYPNEYIIIGRKPAYVE